MSCTFTKAQNVSIVYLRFALIIFFGIHFLNASEVTNSTDICAILEQETQGKVTPFLSSRHGIYYLAGQSVPPNPVKDPRMLWVVNENETLGFTHPFLHDGRARGEGIVTDRITGTGHSLWGWEFWRNTRVLYGSVIDPKNSSNDIIHPPPSSMKWRPDRLTITYELEGGITLREVKFITLDDVVVDILTVVTGKSNDPTSPVTLQFGGSSYVNTQNIPTHDGDPPNTPFSCKRNSTVEFLQATNVIHVAEKGTAWAKPGSCTRAHGPVYPPDVPCAAREGRLMYDGTHVVISSSVPLGSSIMLSKDDERRQLYNFTVTLQQSESMVLAFAQGDDLKSTIDRVTRLLKDHKDPVKAAQSALEDKTMAANTFLNKGIPQFSCSESYITSTYYYAWALYWMYTVDMRQNTNTKWERWGHAQSAINNFMGLHHYDTQFYLPMGAWIVDRPTYAYGNALMWTQVLAYRNMDVNGHNATNPGAPSLPDNMGNTWVSSAQCDQTSAHVEGAWKIYEHARTSPNNGAKEQLLQPAYSLYSSLFNASASDFPHLTNQNGDGLIAMDTLILMARELNLPSMQSDIKHWQGLLDSETKTFQNQWEYCAKSMWGCDLTHPSGLQSTRWKRMNDTWVDAMARDWAMNSDYGFYPRHFWDSLSNVSGPLDGPPIRNFANNATAPPLTFVTNSPRAYRTIEGFFRHGGYAAATAVNITLGHLLGMYTTYNFTVFPEAWDVGGRPWGDQWYNWGGTIGALMPLEHLIGVSYSHVTNVFTVCDYLPTSWSFAEAQIPVNSTQKGISNEIVTWVSVRIERLDNNTKRITIQNNPLGSLSIQPWLEGRILLRAVPEGWSTNTTRGHIGWNFTGSAARSATVTVTLTDVIGTT